MKTIKNTYKGIVFVGLIILLSLCSCDKLSDDCDEYTQTVERYEELIERARDNGDSVQVHLLIDERNRKLSNLDC
jgi:hypothetical protein